MATLRALMALARGEGGLHALLDMLAAGPVLAAGLEQAAAAVTAMYLAAAEGDAPAAMEAARDAVIVLKPLLEELTEPDPPLDPWEVLAA